MDPLTFAFNQLSIIKTINTKSDVLCLTRRVLQYKLDIIPPVDQILECEWVFVYTCVCAGGGGVLL